MKEIWKYPLSLDSLTTLQMAAESTVLCAQMQAGVPTLWAIGNPSAGRDVRTFTIQGTGWKTNVSADRYVGTVQDAAGFVWHVFEV